MTDGIFCMTKEGAESPYVIVDALGFKAEGYKDTKCYRALVRPDLLHNLVRKVAVNDIFLATIQTDYVFRPKMGSLKTMRGTRAQFQLTKIGNYPNNRTEFMVVEKLGEDMVLGGPLWEDYNAWLDEQPKPPVARRVS